jgi:hypothetical protein
MQIISEFLIEEKELLVRNGMTMRDIGKWRVGLMDVLRQAYIRTERKIES